MKIDVSADVKAAEKDLGAVKNGVSRAAQRALNLAIRRAESAAVKAIAADIGIKQKSVRASLRRRLAHYTRLTAELTARGARVPLIDLGAKQTKNGVTYRSGRGRKLAAGAFIATMASGHKGVFKRRYHSQKSQKSKGYWGDTYRGRKRYFSRLPIDELHGPSIPRVFIKDRTTKALHAVAVETFDREFKRQLDLLRKAVEA